MTKREEVVAAVEAALISNWRLDYKVQATAALDAALRVLGEPDAEMVEAGQEHGYGVPLESYMADVPAIFRAMLATVGEK